MTPAKTVLIEALKDLLQAWEFVLLNEPEGSLNAAKLRKQIEDTLDLIDEIKG